MGGGLSRAQAEAAAGTVVSAAASYRPGERWGVERVDVDALSSLIYAGWIPQDGLPSRSWPRV